MEGFLGNIEYLTERNNYYRHVVYTGNNMQLVLMALKPGEEIGGEVHVGHDQFFRIEDGSGEVFIDGNRTGVEKNDAIIIPAGARHNIINTGKIPLLFYTIYSPPEYLDGAIHKTKDEADSSEEHFDGRTTEFYSRSTSAQRGESPSVPFE